MGYDVVTHLKRGVEEGRDRTVGLVGERRGGEGEVVALRQQQVHVVPDALRAGLVHDALEGEDDGGGVVGARQAAHQGGVGRLVPELVCAFPVNPLLPACFASSPSSSSSLLSLLLLLRLYFVVVPNWLC